MGAGLEKEFDKMKEKNPKELDLRNRGIKVLTIIIFPHSKDIPFNIEVLDQLERLNLSNNKIKSLPPTIGLCRF